MKRRAANHRSEYNMAEVVIPCYGGPYDGEFRNKKSPPIGYRSFDVRGRIVWLWKEIKIERIDFATLSRASKIKPEDEDSTELDTQ